MRVHSGERPYKCVYCNKVRKSSFCLQKLGKVSEKKYSIEGKRKSGLFPVTGGFIFNLPWCWSGPPVRPFTPPPQLCATVRLAPVRARTRAGDTLSGHLSPDVHPTFTLPRLELSFTALNDAFCFFVCLSLPPDFIPSLFHKLSGRLKPIKTETSNENENKAV